MSKVIVVVGFGPGVSAAVAETFGARGFSVALIGRTEARLAAGVDALRVKGVEAKAFPADAGDPASIREAIAKIRADLGRIGVLHWNASSGHGVGDLSVADPANVTKIFSVAVAGFLSAVQAALPDLRDSGDGAVLATNGAFGDLDPALDALAATFGADAIGLANATKAKLVGLLAARLKKDDVFVGEVTIGGIVRGTGPQLPGIPFVEASDVAEAFWDLFTGRSELRRRVG